MAVTAGLVHFFIGDMAGAEREFRNAFEEFGRQIAHGTGGVSFAAARLAQVLFELGRVEEALDLAESALTSDPADEWVSLIAGGTRAKAMAHNGRVDEAVASAQNVVSRARASRFDELPLLYGGGLEDLGQVLAVAGDREGAATAFRDAESVYQQKGATALVKRVRVLLASLA
jgi:hypothetical protein